MTEQKDIPVEEKHVTQSLQSGLLLPQKARRDSDNVTAETDEVLDNDNNEVLCLHSEQNDMEEENTNEGGNTSIIIEDPLEALFGLINVRCCIWISKNFQWM